MRTKKNSGSIIISAIFLVFVFACGHSDKGPKEIIASSPKDLERKALGLIRAYLETAIKNKNLTSDSIVLRQPELAKLIYDKNDFSPAWSKEEKWTPNGDSLYHFIAEAQRFGLFPEDYHFKELTSIHQLFFNDSAGETDRKNALLWARADVLLTDAFVQVLKDVKLGRLPQDSITLRKDSALADDFFVQKMAELKQSASLSLIISSLEPRQPGYYALKDGIKKFLDSSDSRAYTVVPAPGGDRTKFKAALQKRLFEAGFLASDSVVADSVQLAAAIKKFQVKKNITVDGKAGEGTVRMLNTSDREKFIRIAISMDKYKMLPDKMPPKYIWVNLPGYSLQLWDGDSIKLSSKVICGKPLTKTPQLTSAISEMITYPKWTVPTSIIVKEILPGEKRNANYLAKKGFSLFDRKGNEVDPTTVDWSKYSKGIPYQVVQGSGDANALGIFKFNFNNKYAVYLHDTNQRYLFGLNSRDLSHGCVRVQEWQPLADYIIHNDSPGDAAKPRLDSLKTWLSKKQKHSIPVHNRLPLFIRYFTCEGKNGGIVFYDDIYSEDKRIQEKYFAGK